MPRSKTYDPSDLLDAALRQFWAYGFSASSVDDLVRATGVSRHGLYAEHPGKEALFLACFAHYREKVVDPAFAQVEAPEAGLDAIASYFEQQIALAESVGLPGPGCFVGNASTETAPHDARVRLEVAAHNRRLKAGFRKALESHGLCQEAGAQADALLVFATGLWALSRIVDDAEVLRGTVRTYLNTLGMRVACT